MIETVEKFQRGALGHCHATTGYRNASGLKFFLHDSLVIHPCKCGARIALGTRQAFKHNALTSKLGNENNGRPVENPKLTHLNASFLGRPPKTFGAFYIVIFQMVGNNSQSEKN